MYLPDELSRSFKSMLQQYLTNNTDIDKTIESILKKSNTMINVDDIVTIFLDQLYCG